MPPPAGRTRPDWNGQDLTGSRTLPQPIGPGVAGPDTQRLGPCTQSPPPSGSSPTLDMPVTACFFDHSLGHYFRPHCPEPGMLSHCHVPSSRARTPRLERPGPHRLAHTPSAHLPGGGGPGYSEPRTHPPQPGRPGYLLPAYSTVTPVDPARTSPDSDDIDHSITTPSAWAGLSHMRPDSDGTDGSITAQALLFAPVVP